jgi:hypothetical protein
VQPELHRGQPAACMFLAAGNPSARPQHGGPWRCVCFCCCRIFNGASFVFFSFIGFDCVSTLAEEVKNPAVDMPVGIVGCISVVGIICECGVVQLGASGCSVLGVVEVRFCDGLTAAGVHTPMGVLCLLSGLTQRETRTCLLGYGWLTAQSPEPASLLLLAAAACCCPRRLPDVSLPGDDGTLLRSGCRRLFCDSLLTSRPAVGAVPRGSRGCAGVSLGLAGPLGVFFLLARII